jgi:hypothetical protein
MIRYLYAVLIGALLVGSGRALADGLPDAWTDQDGNYVSMQLIDDWMALSPSTQPGVYYAVYADGVCKMISDPDGPTGPQWGREMFECRAEQVDGQVTITRVNHAAMSGTSTLVFSPLKLTWDPKPINEVENQFRQGYRPLEAPK